MTLHIPLPPPDDPFGRFLIWAVFVLICALTTVMGMDILLPAYLKPTIIVFGVEIMGP